MASTVTPFNATACKAIWADMVNKTTGKAKNINCPNQNYAKKTKEYSCQVGFGCCYGEAKIPKGLIKACASSNVVDKMCDACTSSSAAEFLTNFASDAVEVLHGHIS